MKGVAASNTKPNTNRTKKMNTGLAAAFLANSTPSRPRFMVCDREVYYLRQWTDGKQVDTPISRRTAKELTARGVITHSFSVSDKPAALAPVKTTPPPAPTPDRIGGFFWMANNRLEVIKIDSFGGVEHYGFRSVPSMSVHPGASTGTALIGWIPSALVNGLELTA